MISNQNPSLTTFFTPSTAAAETEGFHFGLIILSVEMQTCNQPHVASPTDQKPSLFSLLHPYNRSPALAREPDERTTCFNSLKSQYNSVSCADSRYDKIHRQPMGDSRRLDKALLHDYHEGREKALCEYERSLWGLMSHNCL